MSRCFISNPVLKEPTKFTSGTYTFPNRDDLCVFYNFPGFLLIPSGKIKNIHCCSFVMTCKCRKKDGYIAINNYLIT